MDPRYKRSSSSGRYANPARSSTGTFVDPYDYTSYHPSSPRSSIGGSPYDYNTERNKTPKDSLIFHTESSPIPEPPRDQQPDDMVWDGGNLSTSPTSVKTPNGRLAPPTLQVNTRQRNISEAETITPFNFLPSSGLRPRGSLPKEPLGDSTTHIPIRYHDDTEEDLEVDNNKFTFSPTELRQLLSSKSTRPFYAVERLKRIELGLRQDRPKADVMNDERMYIPGFLAHLPQFTVKALPDTGAKYNFMKESQAKELGVPIQRDIIRSVIVTKAKTIRTVGVVVAPFTFQGETESHLLKFHLLKDCVHDIILGKAFLKATKTFSNMVLKAKRVVTNFTQRLATLRLNYLGDSAPRFTGLLNGRIRQALGDTGAQGLFMDEKFARANGFSIVDDPDSILNVQYADGSTATTIGMVHGIKWEYGLGGRSVEYMLDFHVLKDAPADIILSDDFLHDTEAFAEYDCYLIDVDDEDDEDDEEDEGHLFAIKLFKKQVQSGIITGAKDYACVQEAHQMAQEEQRLDDLARETARMRFSQPQTHIFFHPPTPTTNTLPPDPTVLGSTPSPLSPAPSLHTSPGPINSTPATQAAAQPPPSNTPHAPNIWTTPPAINTAPQKKQAKNTYTKLARKLKQYIPTSSP